MRARRKKAAGGCRKAQNSDPHSGRKGGAGGGSYIAGASIVPDMMRGASAISAKVNACPAQGHAAAATMESQNGVAFSLLVRIGHSAGGNRRVVAFLMGVRLGILPHASANME